MPELTKRYLLLLLALAILVEWGCSCTDSEERDARLAEVKIVLDPGHGGKDAGAAVSGIPPEKHLVLEIARQVEEFLTQKKLRVILTRRTDEFVSLSQRANVANEDHATLFVSVHANSCPREEVSGFEIYCAADGRGSESLEAAACIQRCLKVATRAEDRGVRKRNYAVLAWTKCPSVLVEVGYLSNRREARLLSRRSYRRRVARGIANGIVAYVEAYL